MPISHYPRPGYPLAPTALKTVLAIRIPKKLLGSAITNIIHFCDLNKNAWETFSPEVCQQLGMAIVETIRAAKLTKTILRTPLPSVPSGISIEDLELEQRTYNCLCKMQLDGLLGGPQDLGNRTIREVLNVENFGVKSLVDLLTSLEAAGTATARRVIEEAESEEPIPLSESTLGAVFVGRFRHLRLPTLPAGTRLSDLDLASRTYNCLVKHGFTNRVADLASLTLGEAMEIPGFGRQCLVDYLGAVERVRHGTRGQADEDLPPLHAPLASGFSAEKHQFLEDELRDLLLLGRKHHGSLQVGRNVDIVAKYYGLDGAGGATLQDLGDQFGLTRERVRQICERSIRHLKRVETSPPRLQEVLSVVSRHLPSEAESLEKRLQQEGLTRSSFRLEGLLLVTKLLGQTRPFELEDIEGRRMAVHPEKVRMTKRTIVLARKTISKFGVATGTDVAAILSDNLNSQVTPEFVTRVLEAQYGFEWLDRESGWFWFRNLPKNRVVSRIRKILSVADGIEVGELRLGIARHHLMNGYSPPRRVLLELCKRLPYCKVEENFIRAEPGIDWKSVLRGTELDLITVLKEHGPVMQRANLEQHCMALGMNRSTFYVYLDYSPVIERFASGIYGIRGSRVVPGLVESLIPLGQRSTSVQLDHGWTGDRRIWIGYRLSEGMVRSGVFGVPGSMKQFVQGKYTLKTSDGVTIGTVVVKENSGWGIGPFFRRRGGEPGDTLLIIFDAKAQEAAVSIGDESLLDQFQMDGTTDLKPQCEEY